MVFSLKRVQIGKKVKQRPTIQIKKEQTESLQLIVGGILSS